MNPLKTILAASLVAGLAFTASGQNLIGWDFNGLPGGSWNFGPSPFTATEISANITSSGLIRNHTLGTGTGAARGWGANNWDTNATSAALAITADNFFTFTIAPAAGFQVSLTSINSYNIRRSSSGPSTGIWQYQIGTGSFTDIGSAITWGSTTTVAGNAQSAIDLSGFQALQDVTDTITIRLVAWGATNSGGTLYLNEGSTQTDGVSDFSLAGSVTAIPEPGTIAALIDLGAFGLVVYVRRRRKVAWG
jgi:hypothetical protein